MVVVPSVREAALNPEWIPHSFEGGGEYLTSVFVPRDSRSELVFLTDGQLRGEFQKATFPAALVEDEATSAPRAPLHFIFHTSFCGSTLLARALDARGVSVVLREPNILVNLAEALIRKDSFVTRGGLELAARLLARPFENGEAVVVKASSFANRLIEPLLQLRPESRAILLFSDASTYLSSLVKRGLLARINGRKLYRNMAAWTPLEFGFSPAETFEQTDLQIAGLAWLMQIAYFDRIQEKLGPERAMVLDAAAFMADPASTLDRVRSFFGLGFDEKTIREIVEGPVFSQHSKFSGLDYDSKAREQDQESLLKVHAEELGMVLQWLNAVAAHLRLPLRPRNAI